jgi:hypothetical protein
MIAKCHASLSRRITHLQAARVAAQRAGMFSLPFPSRLLLRHIYSIGGHVKVDSAGLFSAIAASESKVAVERAWEGEWAIYEIIMTDAEEAQDRQNRANNEAEVRLFTSFDLSAAVNGQTALTGFADREDQCRNGGRGREEMRSRKR